MRCAMRWGGVGWSEQRPWTEELIPDPFAEGAMGRLVGPSQGAAGGGGRDAMGRVAALLGKIGTRGERVVCGGGFNAAQRAVEPTVVVCGWDSELMLEEMFCPILCVIPYDDLRTAAQQVRARPKPLTLYIFSQRRAGNTCVSVAAIFTPPASRV